MNRHFARDEVEMAFRWIASRSKPRSVEDMTWFDEKNKRQANRGTCSQHTVGRVLFNYILPDQIRFHNGVLEKAASKI